MPHRIWLKCLNFDMRSQDFPTRLFCNLCKKQWSSKGHKDFICVYIYYLHFYISNNRLPFCASILIQFVYFSPVHSVYFTNSKFRVTALLLSKTTLWLIFSHFIQILFNLYLFFVRRKPTLKHLWLDRRQAMIYERISVCSKKGGAAILRHVIKTSRITGPFHILYCGWIIIRLTCPKNI